MRRHSANSVSVLNEERGCTIRTPQVVSDKRQAVGDFGDGRDWMNELRASPETGHISGARAVESHNRPILLESNPQMTERLSDGRMRHSASSLAGTGGCP